MERRGFAGSSPRGGEDIQAPREARTGIAAGAGAVAIAAALASVPLVRGSDTVQQVGVRVAAVALVALVAALVLGRSSLLPVSLVLLGGLYGAQLGVDDAALDGASPMFAVGLYLTAELGYWSLEERERVRAEPGEGLRRVGFVAVLGLGTLVVTAGLLVLVDAIRAGGLAVDILGAAAAAAALLAVVVLARR